MADEVVAFSMEQIEALERDGKFVRRQTLYMPLVEALVAYEDGRISAEDRMVPVSHLRIDPGFAVPENIVTKIFVPRFKQLKHRVLVMRRTDGSMWVYDDCATVQAAQMIDSTIRFACSIFDDPTQ